MNRKMLNLSKDQMEELKKVKWEYQIYKGASDISQAQFVMNCVAIVKNAIQVKTRY
jgi:hypothetical protein